jgi:hypothetical protein
MAAEGGMRTRQAAGILNVLKASARLEVWSNFFTMRVSDGWNNVPDDIKMTLSVGQFKGLCISCIERPAVVD